MKNDKIPNKTAELRANWIDYINELTKLRWSIKPDQPEWNKLSKSITELLKIAQNVKSGEIEPGDTVTNGTETFIVHRIENDRVYGYEQNSFRHLNTLRLKHKFN